MTSRAFHSLKSIVLILALIGLVGCQATTNASSTTGKGTATPKRPESPPTATATPEPVVFAYPGEDWGYPSPFARYSRGLGYIRMSLLLYSRLDPRLA